MTITSKDTAEADRDGTAAKWTAVWRRLTRPIHHGAVHELRVAAESADAERLASLLDPGIAVVVDSGDREHPVIRVVNGIADAVELLLHGLAPKPGLVIEERSVNGQAGLILGRDDKLTAAINVDFSGRLVSAVWIRLHPERLRHGNRV